MLKKYDVICPHCCGIFHETNEKFIDTNAAANGSMFTPKTNVVEAGWTCFPPYETTEYANVTCPACDQQYLDSDGRVLRLKQIGTIEAEQPVQRTVEFYGQQYAEVEPKTKDPVEPEVKKRGRRKVNG